jgi:hypothetical protein
MGLYNLGIMNLLDIPHFGHDMNFSLCVKTLVAYIYGGILWMDRPVQIDVALISKITVLPIVGAYPEEYLENKAH